MNLSEEEKKLLMEMIEERLRRKELDKYRIPDDQRPQTPGLPGWICPRCGRGLSPYTTKCPCVLYPKIELSFDSGSTKI
jgi:hypothetical protein